MTLFKKILFAAIITLGTTQAAHADLVATDWKTLGDNSATLDTDTGLEWLDLSTTKGLSYSDVMDDSNFDGWRPPTFDEVITLFFNAFSNDFSLQATIQDGDYYTQNRANTSSNYKFISLFGTTLGSGNSGYYTSQDSGNGYRLSLGRGSSNTRLTINNLMIENGDNLALHNYKSGYVGMFLVSDGGTTLSSRQDPSINANNANAPINDVSAPALLGMMGLGLFGFVARRRSPAINLNK
jgi:MYXO-CTERM domain-containing protein